MTEPFYTVAGLEAAKSVGFLLKRCGGLMSQIAERRFAAEPLSFTQWMVLATLARYERLTASALSAETCHDMGGLTRMVDGLEAEGLVRRERTERDRRVVEITLTPEGRRRFQSGKRLVVELLNSLVVPFARQEIETMIALLQRLMERLQEAEQTTPGGQPPKASGARRRVSPQPLRLRPPRRAGRARRRQSTGE